MRYQVLLGKNNDADLPWSQTLVVEAEDQLTAAMRAGVRHAIDLGEAYAAKYEVLAIESEAEAAGSDTDIDALEQMNRWENEGG